MFSHWEGEEIRTLSPLSETEFRFADYEDRLRFELAGDKMMDVYYRAADKAPEESLQKKMEPIEDKNPEITALI